MELDEQKEVLLKKHLECVLKANKIHNLTTIKSEDEAKILHIEDSLAGLLEVSQAKEGFMVDLGSGAGYPGIPLAIVSGRKTTLVETVGKKADCLDFFINQINMTADIFVSNFRIEEEAVRKPNYYAVATARALSALPSLIELASPLLAKDGCLICYKSESIDKELEEALNIQEKLGMKYISNRLYKLSNGIVRRIVVFNKVANPTINLPRKLGLAQKRALR